MRFWQVLLLALALLLPRPSSAQESPAELPGLAGAPDATAASDTTAALGSPDAPSLPSPGSEAPTSPKEAYQTPSDAPRVPAALTAARRVPPGFTSHEGGWFTIAYPVAMRDRVQPLIAEADKFRGVLSNAFGQPVLLTEGKNPRVWVLVARTPGEMASLAPEGYPPPKYASGVAYSSIGLVLLTIDSVSPGQNHSLEEVFRHELAHVALYDAVQGAHVPRWFNEGFAIHISGEGALTRLQSLWTAVVAEQLIPLKRLDNSFPSDSMHVSVAYAQSADVVRYLIRNQDTQRFHSLIERMRPKGDQAGQPFAEALNDAYGISIEGLEFEWKSDVSKRYTFWPILFSGGFVWMGAIVLFGLAWRKRRKHHHETLARWEQEEAEEDRRRTQNAVRVHIVMPGAEPNFAFRTIENLEGSEELRLENVDSNDERLPSTSDREVPKVRHDGSWYTLH